MQGIKMSYRLQEVIQKDPSEPIRGIRMDDDNIISLNSFIYSLIRSNRSQRRAMLQSLLNMFDETGVCNLFLHDTCSVWASVVAISPLGEKAARSNSM